MTKLLFLRAFPLVLRPMVILLEGYLLTDKNILVLTLPIAMMALTVSSIPVHIDYYRADPTNSTREAMGKQYVSGLLWITLLSLTALAAILSTVSLGMNGWLITTTCLFFLIEKGADETSRMLEFRKAFVKWFFVQIARSGWMVPPILAALAGFPYVQAFTIISALTAFIFGGLFLAVTGLRPVIDRTGLASIWRNIIYLVGSILPASYRQLPRIFVARLFPEQAHIFLATAQLTQGVGLLFNVRFQIPYRKLIARKTRLFQRLVRPAILRLLVIPAVLAPLGLLAGFVLPSDGWSDYALGVALFPLLTADAVMFAILAAHLGYLPWFESRVRVLITYVNNALLLLALILVYELPQIDRMLSVFTISSSFIFLGICWLAVILYRHFPACRAQQEE